MVCTPTIVGCCCVNNPCCPDKTLPPELLMVISGSGAPCDGSYKVKYNPVEQEWESFTAIGGCPATDPPLTTLSLFCAEDPDTGTCRWGFSVENDFVAWMHLISCDPLHLQYAIGFANLVPCGCGPAAIMDVFEI